MENLGKIYHKYTFITINGDQELSGEYHVFNDFLGNFLSKLPAKFPNFGLEILNVAAEYDRAYPHVNYTADNLDTHSVHMFVAKEGLQAEFRLFDDSQIIASALAGK